ncbi:MAG TPA: hypothetical protein VFQ27_10965 [Xanthobacteraceae bacterium]|jgi:hypothetical protein|nr:hypothetical protein [Xanthobacteraceae bacterium]
MIRFSPRYFVLPLLALVVIGSLPAPADNGRTENRASGCGPAVAHIIDPDLRAQFVRFDRRQSPTAAKVCALYRNDMARARR